MTLCRIVAGVLLLLLPAFSAGQDSKLNWDWRNQEVIGRNDPSVGNTSRLTEPERSSLMDAIVLRLQKPMSDAGYDDDRIREIASTTRIRFVDLGDGKPLLLATSLGLEGGCDAMGNCPLWVFRRTDEGFLSLLTAIAASYTLQPREGDAPSDLVLMHHINPLQSGLRLYHDTDGKLVDAGCFEANWHKPTHDPTQMSEPDIQPCNEERLNQYGLPTVRSVHPYPDDQTAHPVATVPAPQGTPPAADAPSAEPPKEQAPSAAPAEQPAPGAPAAEPPKEQSTQDATPQQAPAAEQSKESAAPSASPAPEPPKSEPTQPPVSPSAPDGSQESPKQDQSQPSSSEPAPASDSASKPEQQKPATDQQAPDAGQSATAPKNDEQPQQPPAEQQAPPANQEQPKPEPGQTAPDQQPSKPDTAQPPASDDKPSEPAPRQDQPSPDAAPPGSPQAPQSPNPQ